MALTKARIVESLERIWLPKKEGARVIEDLLEIIKRTLTSGEDVLISGFVSVHPR